MCLLLQADFILMKYMMDHLNFGHYSGLNFNQDKARQRRIGLNLIHYTLQQTWVVCDWLP
jgi:hypothetical protein